MNREAALAKLLAGLFNTGELRLHLAAEPEGEELRGALPERGAPLQELAMEAATALARRGLLDVGFFERLAEARPRRTKEIVDVRTLWLRGADLEKNALWSEGRYRLLEPLGHGGFGFVWKALDTQTQRFVALKILHEQHATSRRIRQRFFRGASVLQQLSHTGVVKVCSAIEQEGLRYFYVMEFLGGVSLENFVKAGGHTRDELLELLFQAGDALAYVNERGLFHRDVKPANILITPQGQAKLLDFDLVTGDDFVTLTTTAQGTPTYMPPEAHTADKETQAYDVFGLARTFEFVLRGRERLVAEAGPDPTQSLEIPRAARTALRAGLHPDPTRRTQTVRGLCDALRGALLAPAKAAPSSPLLVTLAQVDGLSVGSDPPPVDPPGKPWFRSKRWVVVAPTVALMSVLAGLWIWRDEEPAANGDTPGPTREATRAAT